MGPFETEREALEAVRHAYEPQDMPWADIGAILIEEECEKAGITLGAYDKAIIEWIARQPPATVAVVCGLIHRAHPTGGNEGQR